MRPRISPIVPSIALVLMLATVPAPHAQTEALAGQSDFSTVQFSRSPGSWSFFDTRTGDLWIYDESRRMPLWHFRMTELGKTIEKNYDSAGHPLIAVHQ